MPDESNKPDKIPAESQKVTFYSGSQTEAGPKIPLEERQALDAVIVKSHFPRRKRVDLLITDADGEQFAGIMVKLIGKDDEAPKAERFCVLKEDE